MNSSYTQLILDHYRKEAELYTDDASSTMRDETTRGREVAGIVRTLEWLIERGAPAGRLLDIGCGNGYLLEVLRSKDPDLAIEGLEYTPELAEIARSRGVENCSIKQGDVRNLPYDDGAFDIVVTERCVINVMDRDDQAKSLHEIGRIIPSGGHYICIEAFTDGLGQLNEARTELGLDENEMAYHNLWFDKDQFLDLVSEEFEVVDPSGAEGVPTPNFLSSHYFMSRVVYPAVTKADIVYNSHFVKFFSFLPPMGNYSPIQFWILKRR
jgi:ubiquinone/menaquinone biosynthesis C-methylase UbiE